MSNNNKIATAFVFKFIAFSLSLALFALLLNSLFSYCCHIIQSDTIHKNTANLNSHLLKTVIIDPGHGGLDGGAVGINGVLEKNLNLDIALSLAELFKAAGIDFILTRNSDQMLLSPDSNLKHKMQDLKNRLLIAENNPNSIFLSIHMNTFPVQKYNGLQVYFSENDPSGSVYAQLIQNYTAHYLQPHNTRKIKAAGSEIYILHKISVPAVLVECGFLSNFAEADILSSNPLYRFKLACIIFAATLEFINIKN